MEFIKLYIFTSIARAGNWAELSLSSKIEGIYFFKIAGCVLRFALGVELLGSLIYYVINKILEFVH